MEKSVSREVTLSNLRSNTARAANAIDVFTLLVYRRNTKITKLIIFLFQSRWESVLGGVVEQRGLSLVKEKSVQTAKGKGRRLRVKMALDDVNYVYESCTHLRFQPNLVGKDGEVLSTPT